MLSDDLANLADQFLIMGQKKGPTQINPNRAKDLERFILMCMDEARALENSAMPPVLTQIEEAFWHHDNVVVLEDRRLKRAFAPECRGPNDGDAA